jgi:hypothetical protein
MSLFNFFLFLKAEYTFFDLEYLRGIEGKKVGNKMGNLAKEVQRRRIPSGSFQAGKIDPQIGLRCVGTTVKRL